VMTSYLWNYRPRVFSQWRTLRWHQSESRAPLLLPAPAPKRSTSHALTPSPLRFVPCSSAHSTPALSQMARAPSTPADVLADVHLGSDLTVGFLPLQQGEFARLDRRCVDRALHFHARRPRASFSRAPPRTLRTLRPSPRADVPPVGNGLEPKSLVHETTEAQHGSELIWRQCARAVRDIELQAAL
jgi:hypothetical protein